ncbi:MAG TPA: hypothetical protein VF152_10010, partial [Acidimicrobiia bacterium]
SVMITASAASLVYYTGTARPWELFLFAAGAIAGFTLVEASVSRGFRYRLRPEPSDVVALGSALSFASVGLGLGTAVLVGVVLDSWLIWPAGAFAATIVYVLASGVEISLAERARRG